jgi:hypothetical protein
MHVSNIESDTNGDPDDWDAEVWIWVVDDDESPVVGAIVTGFWSPRGSGLVEFYCRIRGNGRCRMRNKEITSAGSTTFTVERITFPGYIYNPSDNTDPDGDSDGTSIVIPAPEGD